MYNAELNKVIDNINNYIKNIKRNFIKYDFVIDNIFYAILAKEHILLEGLPGIAKSQIAKTIIKNISGARVFQIQLSKFMSEDYIFGAVNIKKLKEDGIIEHNIAGSIVESNFAFIDEFFDGSDVLLRSLLEIMNERTFTRNMQKVETPLNSIIATSNYKRINKEMEAILDRFLIKIYMKPIENTEDLKNMVVNFYKNINKSKNKSNGYIELDNKDKLEYENLEIAYKAIKNIKIKDSVINKYVKFLKEFSRQSGIYISPRIYNKGLKVLIVNAFLNGRNVLENDDLYALRYILINGEDMAKIMLFDTLLTSFVNLSDEDLKILQKLNDVSFKILKLKSDFEEMDKSNINNVEMAKKMLQSIEKEFYKIECSGSIFEKTKKYITTEISVLKSNLINILGDIRNNEGRVEEDEDN